jgi:hypothetical protein
MRDIADKTHIVDGAHLAGFAALNIAEEYHFLKTRLEGEERKM